MMKTTFFALTICLVFSQIKSQNALNKGVILNQMKELGSKTFNFYETGAVQNQFLVAAVVTNSMLEDPKRLQLTRGCPITKAQISEQVFSDTSMICATSAVVFNTVDEEIWKRSNWKENSAYKDHSWHGEYIFLWEGIFKTLTNRFKAIGSDEPCQTFLYSYFIPCNYNSQKQPYRCSDLLSGYDGTNDICPIKVIGYTTAHPATAKNLEETKNALRRKYDLVQIVRNKTKKTDNNAFERSTQIKKYVQKESAIFQEVFYECLSNSPVEFCCIGLSKNSDRKSRILAIYVNKVVKNFVTTSMFNVCTGSISSLGSYKVDAENVCLTYATKPLSNDCTRCFKRQLVLYISYCTKKAFDMADYFGTPGYNPAHPGWEKYEDKWKNMYIRVNWDAKNVAYCMFRDLSAESLCTAKPSKIPKLDKGGDFSRNE